jgi:hypothetical protein
MPAMRRVPITPPLALVALAIVGSACGGQTVTSSSPTVTSASSSGSIGPSPTSPSPVPTSTPMIDLPKDAPSAFGLRVVADRVPLASLVPADAQVSAAWTSSPSDQVPQIALVWTRGSDPFSAQHGFEIWQRFADTPPWRIVYAFTDAPSTGVLGIRLDAGDVTGDGHPDVLTFEDQGGSGACGVWRVVQSTIGGATQIFRRKTCDTEVRLATGSLRIRAAVYQPGDAHCCPSKFRTTILDWSGQDWTVVERVVTQA